MRFITFTYGDVDTYGVIDESFEKVIDLRKAQSMMNQEISIPATLLAGIQEGEQFVEVTAQILNWAKENPSDEFVYNMNDRKLVLQAPIPRPAKNIFCVGKNYAAHAIEMGSAADIPEHPMIFSKVPTTVIGHEQPVLNHKEITNKLDYEGEIGVIIGKTGKGITEEEALDYVFGYTIINDVTARDLQKRHKQYLIGKSLDTSCPMGPYLTHKSLIEDSSQLDIETKVNGEVRQSSNTKHFIFSIPTIISVLSQGLTLEAGDIIATGTPAGVGNGFNPPKFLQPGDQIEITVEGLGTLRNTIAND